MKALIISMFILIAASVSAQMRLGYTIEEVQSEFTGHTQKLTQSNNVSVLQVSFERFEILYMATDDSITLNVIVPHFPDDMEYIINLLDTEGIQIAATVWYRETNGQVFRYELRGQSFFVTFVS